MSARKVAKLAQNRALRIMLVTDPADKDVPLAQQAGFVEKMRRAGRLVPKFMVQADDTDHHGVLAYTRLVAAGCMAGKSDAAIASAVSTLVKRPRRYRAQATGDRRPECHRHGRGPIAAGAKRRVERRLISTATAERGDHKTACG